VIKDPAITGALARGTVVNFLGVIAKLMLPVFYIAITRLYGPAVFGVYLLANTVIELAISFTFSGFQNGVILFTARHAHDPAERPQVYQVLANTILVVLALTGLAIVLAFTAGPSFLEARYGREGLVEAVQIMALTLPFLAVPRIVVGATRGLMIMRYDLYLLGLATPMALLAVACSLYLVDSSVRGLAWAYFASNAAVSVLAVAVFRRHFSLRELRAAFRPFRFHRPLVIFSIPQGLNMTLVYYMSGISLLFLGAAEISRTTLAFFGTAAELTRQVRQIRIAFSNSFAPVISRLHQEGRLPELADHYTTLTRWVTILTVPVLLVILSLKEPLLLAFHPTYVWDSDFLYLLGLGAFLGCAFGLSANVIAMTGLAGLNLANSVFMAALAFGFNWLLIPPWGLWGAAAATLITTAVSVGAKSVQIWLLYRIRIRWRRAWKPFLAGASGCAVLGLAQLLPVSAAIRPGLTAALSLGAYVLVLVLLRPDPEDRRLVRGLLRGRKESP